MPWSKIVHSQIGVYAFSRMTNPLLAYHNRNHVLRLYDIAAEWDVPYDPELDLAILYHDCIVDINPLKEARSAQALSYDAAKNPSLFKNYNITRAMAMILNTAGHIFVSNVDPTMIMLDVADLVDPVQRSFNFNLIMLETCALYNISNKDAANGTMAFMQDFKTQMDRNAEKDSKNAAFWKTVSDGCIAVQHIAEHY